MSNKFSFGKFIVDCIISFGVMIGSTIILFIPVGIIIGIVYNLLQNLFYFNIGWYEYPLIISICNTICLLLFLYKKKRDSFAEIDKVNFVFCYIVFTSFWWFLVYWFFCNSSSKVL